MKVADRALQLRISSCLQSAGMSRNDPAVARVLVGIGFGVLVSVMDTAIVEQGTVAFGDRFQFAEEIGELLDVPAADVAKHALSFHAIRSRSLAVRVRVIVVA